MREKFLPPFILQPKQQANTDNTNRNDSALSRPTYRSGQQRLARFGPPLGLVSASASTSSAAPVAAKASGTTTTINVAAAAAGSVVIPPVPRSGAPITSGNSQVEARLAASDNAPELAVYSEVMEVLGSQLGSSLMEKPLIKELLATVVRCVQASKAGSTWKAYAPWMRSFCDFAVEIGVKPLDFNETQISLYLGGVYASAERDKVGPQRVETASAAVSALFELAGKPSPCSGKLCAGVREAARRTLRPQLLNRAAAAAEDLKALIDKHIHENTQLSVRIMVT
ncbi:hypothetical protein Agub_g10566, partial [Astrephomene gubernaculifera]